MKGIFRFLGLMIVIAVAGFLILCATSPKTLLVKRAAVINAPKVVVWQQVAIFGNSIKWSPWKEKDPTADADIKGIDGEPGSTCHWMGQTTGESIITNAGVSPDEIKYSLQLIQPYEADGEGYYQLSEQAGKTKVTWSFEQSLDFWERGMMTLIGMQSSLEKDFDRGLVLLKRQCESKK